MNFNLDDPDPSVIAELLLFHAVLGRGYVSPFPVTRGMVFTSALPQDAVLQLGQAEALFRRYHEAAVKEDKMELESLEQNAPQMRQVISGGKNGDRLKALKEKVSKRAHITWKEDQVLKATIVELLKTHYYGAFTYFDAVGSRLGAALSHPSKLAGDLGWTTLMDGTTEETLIRAGSTGGALIHSLTGLDAQFNFYCSCKESQLVTLGEKIKHTSHGQVGIGTTVLIPGQPSAGSGVNATTLDILTRGVFAAGTKAEEKRVKVKFTEESAPHWHAFLKWQLGDLIEEPSVKEWQMKLARSSPTSPTTAILFGARAAMVMEFIRCAEAFGRINDIELDATCLESAKKIAQNLYRFSSGQAGYEKRIQNLKDPKETFVSEHKLNVAKIALEDALKMADFRRLSRNQVRLEVEGVTLSLLDELVKRGDIVELCGVEECRMGKTVRAYTLPIFAEPGSVQDALDEYDEAVMDFAQHPEAFQDQDALAAAVRLRVRAEEVYNTHYTPVVSMSRMSKRDRRMLPKLLQMFPKSFLLRGDAASIPEPVIFAEDDDMPLDKDGINLWVRYRPDGNEFCDWSRAAKLQLAEYWAEELPYTVPS